MCDNEKYAAEDRAAIEKIKCQIIKAGENLATDYMAEKWTKGLTEAEMLENNKSYSFESVNEIFVSLFIFFTSTYNAKHIAKKVYEMDEDDIFKESMDLEIPLGKVQKRKKIKESSIVEATIKVIEFGTLDDRTQLPFELVNFRLISA